MVAAPLQRHGKVAHARLILPLVRRERGRVLLLLRGRRRPLRQLLRIPVFNKQYFYRWRMLRTPAYLVQVACSVATCSLSAAAAEH